MEEMAWQIQIHKLRKKNISDNKILFQKTQDRWLQRSEHVMNKLGKVITNTSMDRDAGDGNNTQTENKLNRGT